jgi:D-serine deaminase-like pyridoxal phosphate-dependent protein
MSRTRSRVFTARMNTMTCPRASLDQIGSPRPLLNELQTPCLLLDEERLLRNIGRLRTRLSALGVPLRPHVKTSKSIEVIRATLGDKPGPVTVSTLKEAEYVFSHGLTDIVYAVGITPNKLDRVTSLRRQGAALKLIVDNLAMAEHVAVHAQATGDPIPVLIEIDSDNHRGGLKAEDRRIVSVAQALASGGAEPIGVLTHAGGSYQLSNKAALIEAAENERHAAVDAADLLREAGFSPRIISVGSTPTANAVENLAGVTEVRAGVFVFFDLVMAGVGVCQPADIAVSVLASVINIDPDQGRILIDAGWTALSRDRGTAMQTTDQFYGMVCDIDGQHYPDIVVLQTSQEHGIVGARPGSGAAIPRLPVGSLVRILPNHACATAAQHDRYIVTEGRNVKASWARIHGW